jgi:hypothetical protein
MATAKDIPSDLAIEIAANLLPSEFLAAARNFFNYVDEITKTTIGGDDLQWRVKVNDGSNVLAVLPNENTHTNTVNAICSRMETNIGDLLAGTFNEEQVSESAFKSLKYLSELVRNGGENPNAIKIWVKKKPIHLNREISQLIQEDWRADYNDYGTLEGVLQAIQDGRSLTIKVKDLLFDNPITCYLKEGLLEDALSNFRKRVELSGIIHYRKNGTPISMNVQSFEVMPNDDDLPSASDVRGILRAAG